MTHQADAEPRLGKPISVDLSQPLVLTIHSPSGDVAVRAVDRSDVLIAFGALGPWDVPGNDESGLTIDVRGNRIEVRPQPRLGAGWTGVAGDIDLDTVFGQITKAFRDGSFFSAKPGKTHAGADIAVEVPQSMAGLVEIRSASGDVLVDRVSGEITLNSMSGDIRAVGAAGPLKLQTASGDMIVDGASGRLSARAASGDVRVVSARLDGFQIQTANGDIDIDAVLTDGGPYRAQTVSGDIRLALRRPAAAGEEPAATLAFQAVSGDAQVSAPFRKTGRGRWQSGPDNRGPRIDVTTVNGDLFAELAATTPELVPAPTPAVNTDDVPSAPTDWPLPEGELTVADARQGAEHVAAPGNVARLAVLEAVERGEIDVEEALRRLDAEDAVASP